MLGWLCRAAAFARVQTSAALAPHALQVYITLTAALVLSTLGVYVSAATGFGQGLGMIGFMVCVPWMLATPATPDNLRKRRGLFAGAALSQVRHAGCWRRPLVARGGGSSCPAPGPP